MRKAIMHDNEGHAWERVSKAKARQLFAAGQPVTFCPVLLHPFGTWTPSITRAGDPEINFDTYLQQFAWYNCTQETGKYTAYYVQAV
jgi:hypothetical protein